MPVPKKRPENVVIKIDAMLKKLWAEQKQKLDRASSDDAHAWDDRYEALDAILNHVPPLYLAGGFASDRAFIRSLGAEDPSTAYRNMRVARYASPDEILHYSPSLLDLAISLVELKNGGPLKSRTPIAFEKLRFAFHDGGKPVTKRFADMTAVELRAAIALARGHEANSKKSSPVAKAVGAVLAKSGVKGATFTVSKRGLVVCVPLDGIAKVGAALARYSPPR